jgi:hypothetical protein
MERIADASKDAILRDPRSAACSQGRSLSGKHRGSMLCSRACYFWRWPNVQASAFALDAGESFSGGRLLEALGRNSYRPEISRMKGGLAFMAGRFFCFADFDWLNCPARVFRHPNNLEGSAMPDQILLDIIDNHLPYEIDMLRGLFRQFDNANRDLSEPEQKIKYFAQIESFCVHARSLLFFFSNKKSGPKDCDDSIASDFTIDDSYKPSFDPYDGYLDVIRRKLNKQIFHLTKDRKIAPNEKFYLSKDAACVLRTIEDAITSFSACLKDEFKHFNRKSKTVPGYSIPALGNASTTGTIYSTSLSIPPK